MEVAHDDSDLAAGNDEDEEDDEEETEDKVILYLGREIIYIRDKKRGYWNGTRNNNKTKTEK